MHLPNAAHGLHVPIAALTEVLSCSNSDSLGIIMPLVLQEDSPLPGLSRIIGLFFYLS